MSGGEVIHPGPARIVLAAAAQLRDPDLVERYREEWLANLQGRARPQQWRDALSLLLRGARATHWAHHDTHDSRSRLVVASQVTMAVIVAVGTVLIFTTKGWEPLPWWRPLDDLLDFYVSLTAVGATGLVLLTKRSWRAALGWLATGIFATFLVSDYILQEINSVWYIASGTESSPVSLCVSCDHGNQWVHIVIWWALYAAITLFMRREIFSSMRVLAAVNVTASARFVTPDWAYRYADRIGLVHLVELMSGRLNMDESVALQVAPGIGFLLGALIVVAAWRCGLIVNSLILPARRGSSGARACPR
ncbi:MAG: hypothetical protein ABIZ05_02510 [Pseudonocardiaceae bacterium]